MGMWLDKTLFISLVCASHLVLTIISLPIAPDSDSSKSGDKKSRKILLSLKNTTNFNLDQSGSKSKPDGTIEKQSVFSTTPPEFASDEAIDYDYLDEKIPDPVKLVNTGEAKENVDGDVKNGNVSLNHELSFIELHERAKIMRITEVKESILSRLRLLAPPNMTALKMNKKLNTYPEHILPMLPDQDEDFQKDDDLQKEDTFHAKISTVIQFAEEFPDDKEPANYPTADIAYFSLPLSVSKRNVEKATLMVYIATPAGKEDMKVQLSISQTLRAAKPFLNRTVTLSRKGHWEHVDITDSVIDWTDDSANYGLIIRAVLNGQNLAYLIENELEAEKEEKLVVEDISARPHRVPLVKIILNENEQGRYKRAFDEAPVTCELDDKEKRCCRYNFVIDFEQMGKDFEFIIHPKRYKANYCAGTCPTYYLPTDTNSHLLQGLAPQKLQRCCSATVTKPLKVLYINDEGNLMLGKIPNMSIQKCECS